LLELVVVTSGRITDGGRRATGEPFTVVTLVTFVWVAAAKRLWRRFSSWGRCGDGVGRERG